MFESFFLGGRPAAMGPDEVRALRGELGWTHEQLADAAGVSALEVSAWEAGAVTVTPDDAAALARAAWRGRRERAWAQADARPCAWGAETRARCEDLRYDDHGQWNRAHRLLRAHQKRCEACGRAANVEAGLPPEPAGLLPAGPYGWLARALRAGHRLPAPLKLLYGVAVAGLALAMLFVVLEGLQFIIEPSSGFRPPVDVGVLVLALVAGWLLADELWDEACLARPYLGGFLKAATLAAPVTALVLWWGVANAAALSLSAVFIVGLYLGGREADAQAAETGASPAENGTSAAPALPGPAVELDADRPSRREMMEAGRYEH